MTLDSTTFAHYSTLTNTYFVVTALAGCSGLPEEQLTAALGDKSTNFFLLAIHLKRIRATIEQDHR